MATLAGTQKDLNDLLSNLIVLDYDAIEAYDAAIARLESEAYRTQLAGFRADHERHTQQLGAILQNSGREPPSGAGAKRFLTQGKVMIASLMSDRAILMAMKANEEDTNSAYERATSNLMIPPHIAEVLRGCLADERRHRAWIVREVSATQ